METLRKTFRTRPIVLNGPATFSFVTSNRFTSLDSIFVIGGTTSTLGDSAAFSLQLKQTVLDGSYTGAFNAAAIDSLDLGAGSVQKKWIFTSFGTLTKNKHSLIRGKLWRSACANNTGTKVFVFKVLVVGTGLF